MLMFIFGLFIAPYVAYCFKIWLARKLYFVATDNDDIFPKPASSKMNEFSSILTNQENAEVRRHHIMRLKDRHLLWSYLT